MFDISQSIIGIVFGSYLTAALSFQTSIKEKNRGLQQAAFLIGLSKFVNERCPYLRTNRTSLYSAILLNEIEIRETKTDDFKIRVDSVVEKLAKDEKASCQLARRNFGPNGPITPKIFSPH